MGVALLLIENSACSHINCYEIKMKNLVYITGPGRSGSTLLDMLLSTHQNVAALGEVHRFSINIGKNAVPYRCSCGSSLFDCEFWAAVIKKISEEGRDPCQLKTAWSRYMDIPPNSDNTNIVEYIPQNNRFGRFDIFNVLLALGFRRVVGQLSSISSKFMEGRCISEDSWYLYEKVSELFNKEVIVDGTKTPGRLLTLKTFNPNNTPIKVIYLLRDGRAVTHARIHRQGVTMKHAARVWVAEHKKISLALKQLKNPPLIIKYEDLCLETDQILAEIFDYIDAGPYDGKIVEFRENTHSLGGNPMRLRRKENKIKLNDKWKNELSKTEFQVFDRIGGKLNRSFGYK